MPRYAGSVIRVRVSAGYEVITELNGIDAYGFRPGLQAIAPPYAQPAEADTDKKRFELRSAN